MSSPLARVHATINKETQASNKTGTSAAAAAYYLCTHLLSRIRCRRKVGVQHGADIQSQQDQRRRRERQLPERDSLPLRTRPFKERERTQQPNRRHLFRGPLEVTLYSGAATSNVVTLPRPTSVGTKTSEINTGRQMCIGREDAMHHVQTALIHRGMGRRPRPPPCRCHSVSRRSSMHSHIPLETPGYGINLGVGGGGKLSTRKLLFYK